MDRVYKRRRGLPPPSKATPRRKRMPAVHRRDMVRPLEGVDPGMSDAEFRRILSKEPAKRDILSDEEFMQRLRDVARKAKSNKIVIVVKKR